MTTITIDRSAGEKLRGLTEPVRVCDEQGVLLGEFRPTGVGIEPPDLEEPGVGGSGERAAVLRGLIERMRRAAVSPAGFPITRDELHERG